MCLSWHGKWDRKLNDWQDGEARKGSNIEGKGNEVLKEKFLRGGSTNTDHMEAFNIVEAS